VLPFVRSQITILEPAVSAPKEARWPPWLWCNLLSLDAPLVAIVWQILFLRCFSVPLGISVAATLGLTVWFIYVADRILDALRWNPELIPPARHAFCQEHWNGMAVTAIAGLFTLGGLCARLPVTLLRNGAALLAAVAVYFAIVHGRPLNLRRFWPKEVIVGGIFCLGTCLAAWTGSVPSLRHEMILPAFLFGAVCVLNCVAIEYWEWNGCSSFWNESPHPLTLWMGRRLASLSFAIAVVAALSLSLSPTRTHPLFFALLLSSLTICYLSKDSQLFTVPSRRVLADVALLTPLLALAIS
jgi:hypothetical protein